MQNEHKPIFVETLQEMRSGWGQDPLSEKFLEVYWKELKKFSPGQFQVAVEKLLANYKVRWRGDFPTALDFYEAIPNFIPEDKEKRNG